MGGTEIKEVLKELVEIGYKEETVREILEKVPCRVTQMALLLRLMNPHEENPCSSIFIYGHNGTGKTHVARTFCGVTGVPHAYISCVENFSGKMFFHSILSQLHHQLDAPGVPLYRVDNMNDFLRSLRNLSEQSDKKTMYIIIDKAERLRQMEFHLLPALLKLSDLIGKPCVVVFISHITWEKFLTGTGLHNPTMVFFPEYSQQELVEIMALDCPPDNFKSFYKAYCNLVLHVFLLACRDINELRHMAKLNFPIFCEPLNGDKGSVHDIRRLWRNIEPHMRKALSSVYLRTVTSTQQEKMEEKEVEELGSSRVKAALDLPYFSKYLLIAGYLASHNPPQTDRRYFCKERQAKMSKRGKASAKNRKTDNRLEGPKAFPLDRLMAIFYSILDGKISSNANLMSQVTSLVTLCLFIKATSDDQLDMIKYKCTVTLDFIQSVAASVDFHLGQYLYDRT